MPFPLEDTQAYLAASDHMIVVAFRGTEPSQIRDWPSDSNTPVIPGPAKKGLVHLGFSRALASVYPEIRDKVEEVRTNDQTLWFTGHSLGGALAMLAGATMYLENPKLLADGVYTFGQPRTCDRLFAAAHDTAFVSRHFRFVNNNDVVARVPPEPAFHHGNAMMYRAGLRARRRAKTGCLPFRRTLLRASIFRVSEERRPWCRATSAGIRI